MPYNSIHILLFPTGWQESLFRINGRHYHLLHVLKGLLWCTVDSASFPSPSCSQLWEVSQTPGVFYQLWGSANQDLGDRCPNGGILANPYCSLPQGLRGPSTPAAASSSADPPGNGGKHLAVPLLMKAECGLAHVGLIAGAALGLLLLARSSWHGLWAPGIPRDASHQAVQWCGEDGSYELPETANFWLEKTNWSFSLVLLISVPLLGTFITMTTSSLSEKYFIWLTDCQSHSMQYLRQ